MTGDIIDYDRLIEDAMRGVARAALAEAAEHGLPGDHHFYISFRTDAEGVEMPAPLRAQYPDEMSIVLQHQFWDLFVDDTGFSVTLSFSGKRQHLHVPFTAMTGFVDPSVKFGLQFGKAASANLPATEENAALPGPRELVPEAGASGDGEPSGEGASGESKETDKIVPLDRFRKK